MQHYRSILFLPILQPRFLAKAHLREADAVILDLEDSIVHARKAEARALVAETAADLHGRGLQVFVRINSQPELAALDIPAAVGANVHGLFVPKVDTVQQLAEHIGHVSRAEAAAGLPDGHTRIVALLETPRSIFNALAIADSSPRLLAISFGVEDYASIMEQEPEPRAMSHAAETVAIAAKAAGIQALGLPGSIARFDDADAMREVARLARRLGYTGSACIHPAQVPIFNEAFGVSDDEARQAARVVEVYEKAMADGLGAIALDGRMIDIPIYDRALATLRRAQRINGG
ncbi:MAG TPA: CoA ester lyase [Burkholderiaceae bacterium]|nr:CoA ester lyase [Burkholderiaceae bacterium]